MRINLEEINDATGDSIKKVQLLRTGHFAHGLYGTFDITPEVLRTMQSNFDSNVRRVRLAVDYFHEAYQEAAGWIEKVILEQSDTQLWIEVDWTPKAREMILNKEVRYLSADFDWNYEDNETKREYGATLNGAGLTNRPFVKDMKAILSDFAPQDREKIKLLLNDKKGKNIMPTFDEVLAAVATLSDDQKAQLAEKLGTVKAAEAAKFSEEAKGLKAQLAEKEKAFADLNTEVSKIKTQLADTEKKASFDVMLSEGKVVEAQRDAYMKGDVDAFAKNAVRVNLSEKGTGGEGANSAADAAEVKLNEEADKLVKEKGVTFAEAYKQVVKANPELAKAAGA